MDVLQAYEGFIENGQFHPIGTNFTVIGRCRVIVTVLDELPVAENTEKIAQNEYLSIIDKLYGSINDSTFMPPSEIPWEFGSPREEMI